MADYRTIADAEVDPDAPLTSSLGYAWRDNPIAIAEGATGAPRIQDGALDNTVTAAGRNWVSSRSSSGSWNSVGKYVMAQKATGASPGDVVSGSLLTPSSASGDTAPGTLPGNWQCQGYTLGGGGTATAITLWLRVS